MCLTVSDWILRQNSETFQGQEAGARRTGMRSEAVRAASRTGCLRTGRMPVLVASLVSLLRICISADRLVSGYFTRP